MAAELDKLASHYRGKGNDPRADLYSTLAAEERATGGPETVVSVQQIIAARETSGPVLGLEAEWQKQSHRFIKLGFHIERGLTEDAYLESLPRFSSQPEQFKGRFDIPILVETKIPVKRQCELAGVNYFLEGLDVKDWKNDPRKYETPQDPYTTWMQDGKKNLKREVRDVRNSYAKDERGATEFDGIALYIAHSEILKDHSIDLPGTQVGSHYAAYLHLGFHGPELDDCRVDFANPDFGAASCGSI